MSKEVSGQLPAGAGAKLTGSRVQDGDVGRGERTALALITSIAAPPHVRPSDLPRQITSDVTTSVYRVIPFRMPVTVMPDSLATVAFMPARNGAATRLIAA
jgi:hypothetical protein